MDKSTTLLLIGGAAVVLAIMLRPKPLVKPDPAAAILGEVPALLGATKPLISGISRGGGAAAEGFLRATYSVPANIGMGAKTVVKDVYGGAGDVYGGAKTVVKDVYSGGKEVVQDIYGGAKSVVQKANPFSWF